ncbi:MAG: alpha-ketoacid dehydrogenase subunit beta [Nanoarchaeota archaeon]
MPRLNMVEAINLALRQEMLKDSAVIVCGEDVAKNGGVFRVTQGLLDLFGEKRVFDTPLAESGIVGSCFGMSCFGLKPVCEIQFEGFLAPAFDQIINNVARIRNRSRGRFHAQMVIRSPYTGGIRALEHHSESVEAFYAHIPGLKVVTPSTPFAAKGLMVAAIRDPDPVLFLEPKRVYRAIKEEVSEEEYVIPLGKARVVKEGSDLTLISYGAMMRTCIEAAQEVSNRYSVEVIDLQTLSPLDKGAIISSVQKTGRVVIVNEAPRLCGFAAELLAVVVEHCLYSLQASPVRVTGFDTVMPLARLEQYYIPDMFRIVRAIKQVMVQ